MFLKDRRTTGRLASLALISLAALVWSSCRIITEAIPTSSSPADTPTPSTPKQTPTPKKSPTAASRPDLTNTPVSTPVPTTAPTTAPTVAPTATATTAPAATPTPTLFATPSPERSCPATAPTADFVNGSNGCAGYVPVTQGNCGVDSTWWYDCSGSYFVGAIYQYIGGGNPWVLVGTDMPTVRCFSESKTYAVGDLVRICTLGGARSCDADHEVNPGMIACCQNHYWEGDPRRVVVTAADSLGTPLEVRRNAGGNPSFAEIVIAHPHTPITVTYCLPPPPLHDGECGTTIPSVGAGCTTKVFTP